MDITLKWKDLPVVNLYKDQSQPVEVKFVNAMKIIIKKILLVNANGATV